MKMTGACEKIFGQFIYKFKSNIHDMIIIDWS